MATIGFKNLVLYDNWPGSVNLNLGKPKGGFDNTNDNDVSVGTYPYGTKIQSWDDNTYSPGPYTMMYLHYKEGSDHNLPATMTDLSVGGIICGPAECTTQSDLSRPNWYMVTNDCTNSDATAIGNSRPALACTSLTSDHTTGGKAGWFWVAGICPIGEFTKYDVSVTGTAVKGSGFVMGDDGTNGITFLTAEGTGERTPVGYSLIASA